MANQKPALIWVRPSRVARRLLFHLFVIGTGRATGLREFTSFEKPGAGLSWVASGQGHLQLGSQQWELKPPPHFCLYSAGRPRVFTPTGHKPLVTRLIWFGGPGLDAWLDELDVERHPIFKLRRPAVIFRAHERLLRLAKSRSPKWEWKVHATLVGVMEELLLSSNLLLHDKRSLPREITLALNAIEADPARDWRADELAAQAGLGYSAFRALFRKHMREAPHDYIQSRRVDLARELLADQRLRVKEVAQRLHFSTEYYFSNFFRRKTGVSPTEFRAHLSFENPQPPTR
ncbi:MAG: helix-turn-helix transcriptional regulator [Verrucomicrobiae bacterium]|nr:helix-turn-helix transcriptional regulator [Verrucomicrobiae bacterium]